MIFEMFNASFINYLDLNALPGKFCNVQLKYLEELFISNKFVNHLVSRSIIYYYIVVEFGIVRNNEIEIKFANTSLLDGYVVN
jgi:hypothetical protein